MRKLYFLALAVLFTSAVVAADNAWNHWATVSVASGLLFLFLMIFGIAMDMNSSKK